MDLSLSEKIKVLELLVRVPFYSVVGFTSGKIVYVSDAEGIMSFMVS